VRNLKDLKSIVMNTCEVGPIIVFRQAARGERDPGAGPRSRMNSRIYLVFYHDGQGGWARGAGAV
jgi:hypothetical protein